MALAADRLYTDTDKKLASYKRYETQFDNDETSTFKKIIYRRLADLKRKSILRLMTFCLFWRDYLFYSPEISFDGFFKEFDHLFYLFSF